MYNLLYALHMLFAVFVIGPLVHAATTAGRGVRHGDAAATATAVRTVRIYAYASLLVVAVGMGLMSADDPDHPGHKVGQIGQTWIWVSLVLWVVAVAIVLLVLVPALTSVAARIGRQESVVSSTGRVAASGGVIGLIFAVIVVLMVYRPGQ